MNKGLALTGALSLLTFLSPAVSAGLLGVAENYNVFLSGDMTSDHSDTEGRIAAGGEVNLSNYSVGLKSAPTAYSLVSGGDTNYGIGGVQNGGVFSGGDLDIYNYGVAGDLTANGSLTRDSSAFSHTETAFAGATSPVNFTAEFDYLKSVSTSLAGQEANGTVTINPYWANMVLTAGTETVNYFNITAEELSTHSAVYFDMAEDQIAIINVSGSASTIANNRMQYLNGASRQNVLFNFFEPGTLDMHNQGDFWATILAPEVDITFNDGVFMGSMIAKSSTGTGQYNYNPFTHDIDPPPATVPEPSAILLMGAGLAGLLGFRRRGEQASV